MLIKPSEKEWEFARYRDIKTFVKGALERFLRPNAHCLDAHGRIGKKKGERDRKKREGIPWSLYQLSKTFFING